MCRMTKDLTVPDAFVGYHDDTAASIVMQICNGIDQNECQEERVVSEQVVYCHQFLLPSC